MESKSFENSAEMRPIPVYVASTMSEGSEIRLVDLWRVIVRRKAIILASLLVSTSLAFIYIFFAEPVYRANAYLLPPPQQSVLKLLIDYPGNNNADIGQYTPEKVYEVFLDNLKSQGVRREFFEMHGLIEHYAAGESREDVNADRVFKKLFNERLKMQVDKKDSPFVIVSFSDRDPKLAAQWLNQFIDYADKRTVQQLFDNVNAAIHVELDQIRDQLGLKLKFSEQRRLDKITNLKEALHIAKALGIKEVGNFPKVTDKTQAGLSVNTAEVPLYMRGTEALKTEIAVLESRKSDEPFIEGFRDLQERSAFLEGVSIDPESLSAVTVDGAARVPYQMEKPRKLLIFVFAALVGLAVGSLLAIIVEFFPSIKNDSQNDFVS